MLQLIELFKTYEDKPLLSGISFSLNKGETVCLLGPSGSGKSTLLRMISGLESPDDGKILWDGEDLASTPPHLRDFGLVFQDYALFPHLDVFANIAFGLKMRNWSTPEIQGRVDEVLDTVNLKGFDKRKVTDLSGGEGQRVALARALAPRPRLLMFDEPLGALDRALKEDLLDELRIILHHMDVPVIYVTHDQEEAFAIADRVLILHNGQIVSEGTPADVVANPRSGWAARFLGLGNVIDGKVLKVIGSKLKVESELGVFEISSAKKVNVGDRVSVLIRPEVDQSGKCRTSFKSRVSDVLFQKDRYKVTLENGLYFHLDHQPKIGALIKIIPSAVECLPYDE